MHTAATSCLFLSLAAAGCSGGAAEKPAAASSADQIAQQQAIQPDRIEEIRRICTRKAGSAVPRCWSSEYDRTHNRKYTAQVTLMIVVAPEGQATDVQVIAREGTTPELEKCLIDEARAWTYPSGSVPAPVNCSFFLQSSM